MAPLPANNTARYIITYLASGKQHDVSIRYNEGETPGPPGAIFLAQLTVILNAARVFMPEDWSLIEANYIPQGGNFTITAALPALVLAGTQPTRQAQAPAALSIPGKTVGGRRALFTLLGVGVGPDDEQGVYSDYRVLASEQATVANLRNALDDSAIVAIDGQEPNWKGYMNVGYNAYWQRNVRP